MCLEVMQVKNFDLHRKRSPRRKQKLCRSMLVCSKLMVQCEECNMWRLVFSKYKLKAPRQKLQQVIIDYSYTCGAKFEDLNLGEDVEVKDHSCGEPIEKLYYSEPMCLLRS